MYSTVAPPIDFGSSSPVFFCGMPMAVVGPVAGGLPHPDPNHLKRLTGAAMEMQAEAAKVHTPDGQPLALRIGMHAGATRATTDNDNAMQTRASTDESLAVEVTRIARR